MNKVSITNPLLQETLCKSSKRIAQMLYDATQHTDLAEEVRKIVAATGEAVTVIDARTLTDRAMFRRQLEQLPEGYVVFTHITRIPQGEDQEIIANWIHWCLKGDYRNASANTSFGSDWEDHIAQVAPGMIAIIPDEDANTPLASRICGGGIGGFIGITD